MMHFIIRENNIFMLLVYMDGNLISLMSWNASKQWIGGSY